MYRKYTEHGLINVKFSCCLWLKKCFIIHLHSLTAVEFQRNCLSFSYFLAFFPLWLWFQATVCPLACLYVHVFALYVSGLFDTYLRVSRSFLMVWSHDCTYQIIAQSPCACICVRFVWIWLCVCVSGGGGLFLRNLSWLLCSSFEARALSHLTTIIQTTAQPISTEIRKYWHKFDHTSCCLRDLVRVHDLLM